MGLFGFRKKESKTVEGKCSCGGKCGISDIKNAKFIVLGACCNKSKETFENVKSAVKELGYTDEVLNIGDNVEIAKFGVMQTPAFVINSKVVSYGKVLKVEEVKKLIQGNID